MTADEKLAMVKTIMDTDAPDDETITSYLDLASNEILQWRYSYNRDEMPEDVPAEYEMTQIQAVVIALTQRGIEGETVSVENGIHRHFKYTTMSDYIHANIITYAKV